VYQALEQIVVKQKGLSSSDTPYSVITNVAPELLAMRVWFDADGKAVTDTDLSKYGISVPGLGFTTADTRAAPQEPPPPAIPAGADAPPASTPSAALAPRFPYAAPLAVGAGLLAALFLWRGIRRKKP
jgi:hypothetical protein